LYGFGKYGSENGGLAQLASAFDWQSKGHGFESRILHEICLSDKTTYKTMKKIFLLLMTAFLFIGCGKDEDTIYDFIGTWAGTYEGNEKGDWNIVVATDGKVTGTMHSDQTTENYHISGYLSESGELNATIGSPADGEFKGTLTREDKKGSGSWTNAVPTPVRTGTWKGEKTSK
jgi:hypothetical protein